MLSIKERVKKVNIKLVIGKYRCIITLQGNGMLMRMLFC